MLKSSAIQELHSVGSHPRGLAWWHLPVGPRHWHLPAGTRPPTPARNCPPPAIVHRPQSSTARNRPPPVPVHVQAGPRPTPARPRPRPSPPTPTRAHPRAPGSVPAAKVDCQSIPAPGGPN